MRYRARNLLLSIFAGCLLVGLLAGQDAQVAKTSLRKPVQDVLPKGTLPHGMRLKLMGPGSMVFIDPVTGELRAPEPGEREALTGSATGRRSVVKPPARIVKLPSGGVAVGYQSTGLDFLVARRNVNGTMSLDHAKSVSGKGGRDDR